MTETERQTQGYRWAISADPDLLVVQLPAIAVLGSGQAHDAMKALFRRRGFEEVSRLEQLVPPVANRVALARVDDDNAELVVHVGDTAGASRIPIPHHDPTWAGRVFRAGELAVLVTDAAVAADGSTTDDRLRRDVAAGGVLAARVPAGEHSPDEPVLTWTSAPSILFDAPGLSILTYQCAAWSVVRVEGELDLRVGPAVHQALGTLSPYLVFDLRHMTFVDASGLRLLTRGLQAARARNGCVRVASPSRQVRKVLAILNLDTALQLFDTLSEALLAPLPTVRACAHRVPVLGPARSPREPRLRMHHGGGHDGQRHRSARRPRIGGG